MPPYQILVLSSGVWWSLLLDYTLFVTSQCDVIFRFACNVLAKFTDTTCIFSGAGAAAGRGGRGSRGRAGGAGVGQGEQENILGQRKLMKNKKIVTNSVCFCSSSMLTSKIITEVIENHSEFSGYSKSCNDYVSSRS